MRFLKRISNALNHQRVSPRGKQGARVYAIGDIHGRLDLLNELLDMISADSSRRPDRPTHLVFLGDLIDRGPDSAGVVERLRTFSPPQIRTVFLAGNHEEVFLRLLAGEQGLLDGWLTYGGAECAISYGIEPSVLAGLEETAALTLLKRSVPDTHWHFLQSFGDTFLFGDYLFVHAGIRPGLSLEYQHLTDLRWIRDPFLSDSGDHGMIVVHGHTISAGVDERVNRIGIDTGAYRTGILTAVGIEDDRRWFMATGGSSG